MPADIINLRQGRKQKKRRDKGAKAEQNRVTFGRAKPQKQKETRINQQNENTLTGKKLDKET